MDQKKGTTNREFFLSTVEPGAVIYEIQDTSGLRKCILDMIVRDGGMKGKLPTTAVTMKSFLVDDQRIWIRIHSVPDSGFTGSHIVHCEGSRLALLHHVEDVLVGHQPQRVSSVVSALFD